MAKLSENQRLARRSQILNAGWRCFARNGLYATKMDDIIAEAGLSAGAVYSYFKNKDELIEVALITSLSGLAEVLRPLLEQGQPPPPAQLLCDIASAIERFSQRDGFDLKRIALLGWSESQRDEKLRSIMINAYSNFLKQLTAIAEVWKTKDCVKSSADTDDVAKVILSLIFGYVTQAAVIRNIEPAHMKRGLDGLTGAAPAG